ncbi:hypothetical protein F5Y04DRAFT_280005 [Hypomontagnella monticulosa]|nr:hypothetical protein F5Y04DRAFT_280005 [Hypomontagnella monticulosa]
MVAECLCEICGQVTMRGIATIITYTVDRHIVQRRDIVVRYGRQAQKSLNLPDSICIFTAEDPGILDGDLRTACSLWGFSLVFAWVFTSLAVLAVGALGALRNPWQKEGDFQAIPGPPR